MNAQDPLDRFVANLHDPDGPAVSAVRSLLAEAGAGAPMRAALGAGSRAGATAEAATGADPRLEHLRYKPGHSVLARVDGGGQPWWLIVRSPRSADKAAKIRARAAESGFPLLDATVPGSGLHLQAGPVGLDKHLHKPLRRGGLVDARGAVEGTVLSYNPWRRVVLRRESPGASGASAPEAPTVLRLWHTAPASAELQASLHAAGVAVLPARRTRAGIEQPWAPGGDLERLLAAKASGQAPRRGLERTAEAVAGLHAALDTVPGLREAGLARIDPPRAVAAARDGLAAVLPDLLPAFDRVGERVLSARAADRSPDVLLHGDLSADQVVLESGGGVRLIDLDRLAIGPAGHDLGGFAAVELIRGRAGTAEALEAAYRERAAAEHGTSVRAAGPGEAAVRAWTAHHLLLRVVEPFRALAPAWREQVEARIRQASAVLEGDAVGADA